MEWGSYTYTTRTLTNTKRLNKRDRAATALLHLNGSQSKVKKKEKTWEVDGGGRFFPPCDQLCGGDASRFYCQESGKCHVW